MRSIVIFASVAISLFSPGCAKSDDKPIALASADECGAMITVARDKLKLTGKSSAILQGMDRNDWRPDCDWETAGVNFRDARKALGYNNIAMSGWEVTFYRPKFDSYGVIVQFERLSDSSEDVFTCRLSRYGKRFLLSSCTESYVDPMGTMISADDMIKAIEDRHR
jgi:hypothetical protein